MPDSLAATLLDAALRGMLLALIALLAAILARDRPALPAARAALALLIGQAVQVVGATPFIEATLPRLWLAPLMAISVGNAVLFWIFVQALFDDDFAFRPVHAAAWLAVAALAGINCAWMNGSTSAPAMVTTALQRGVPLLFAVLATLAAAAHWQADLVEGRRRLRAFIVLTGVAYTVAMLAVRLAMPQGRLTGMTATADVAALLLIVGVTAVWMLRLDAAELFPAAARRRPESAASAASAAPAAGPVQAVAATAPAAAPAVDPADEALAEALLRMMGDERAYRTEDLTVAGLAARLGTPEYRLRRLINQRLGHRNFNAFVNSFRLDDARAALADPAQRALPVLTIALTAGFQSIGPFNRAFKAATGLTPTEYRREKLADS